MCEYKCIKLVDGVAYILCMFVFVYYICMISEQMEIDREKTTNLHIQTHTHTRGAYEGSLLAGRKYILKRVGGEKVLHMAFFIVFCLCFN